jgi:hypothetical protein
MSKKHNTKHPDRSRSSYSKRSKAVYADKYGEFKEGRQVSSDTIADTRIFKKEK